ncbi:acyl-CoA thioesterase [Candidatus Riflebacteria bacterium]
MKKPGVSLFLDYPLTIQTYDVDMVGIVSNITYVRWLEDMRMSLLEKYYPMEKWWDRGITPILSRTDIHYRLPLHFGAKASGWMGMVELQYGKWILQALFFSGNTVHCNAQQEGYFVDAKKLKPIPIPDEFRMIFETNRHTGSIE